MVESRRSVRLAGLAEPVALTIRREFDPRFVESVRGLLGHKGTPWLDHIDDYLTNGREGHLEGLEWRFHLAEIGGRPVANICLWEHRGVALLGHVYTMPEFRRRGLARALFDHLHDEFHQRGGLLIQLNTHPGTHQHAFYASLGYEPLRQAAGSMVRVFAEQRTEPDSEVEPMPFEWRHWPTLHLFFLEEGRPFVRSVGMNAYGPAALEGRLLGAFYREGLARARRRAWVVEAAGQRVVGFASILPDRSFGGAGRFRVFDLFVEAFHRRLEPALIRRVLEGVREGLVWYREVRTNETVDPRTFGFVPTGVVPDAGDGRDVEIWHREPVG
ncbi:MAG: GNAT family N-acetyltransferase [Candidatus Sumerlaeia bacterium]|nr:GNAT family N-acetyltransferase [Candidatus Sumerlaeia bacterium]